MRLAVEKLLGPDGATARDNISGCMYSEITRILNHILEYHHLSPLILGAVTPSLVGLSKNAKILMEFYERVSGSRMHANYFRPGGVHHRHAGWPWPRISGPGAETLSQNSSPMSKNS